jgi:hypothetical protein
MLVVVSPATQANAAPAAEPRVDARPPLLAMACGATSAAAASSAVAYAEPRTARLPLLAKGMQHSISTCCAVGARRHLLSHALMRGQRTTPLFRLANGQPVRTGDVRECVRALMRRIGCDPLQFGAHSLRIGGATAAMAAGVWTPP